MKLYKHFLLFMAGADLYALLEVLWRGYSHWTMALLGGICFLAIGLINEVIPWEMPLWQQGIIGALLITILEFATGCIVNLWLGWHVWDYSDMPFNLQGQICLPFTLLWFFVSIGAIILDDYIRYWFFGEEKPHYRWLKRKEG